MRDNHLRHHCRFDAAAPRLLGVNLRAPAGGDDAPDVRAPEGFDDDVALHLGIAGCWGEYPAQEAARNADVILALGCRFSDIHSSSWLPGYTYNIPPTKLIHVDIDPQEIGRNYPTELGIVGDVREVLKQLLALAEQRGPKRDRSPWHDQVEAYKEEWSNFIEQEKASDAVPIDPRRVIKELRAAAPEDTLMITDTGNHQTWVEQYWDVYGPQSIFTPGGFAGMGFGTYGVLGLKLARPEQPAVCVTSDGSFMMFPGAVATATDPGAHVAYADALTSWGEAGGYESEVLWDICTGAATG